MTSTRFSLTQASNTELLAALHALVRRSNEVTADLLAHIAEVDARGLYREHAFSNMFTYCTTALRLSEPAAAKRLHAARAARRFPVLFELVASGDLHLSAVTLLAPHLTDENHATLLDACRGKSKRGVEELLAARFPAPDAPARLRRLPETAAATASLPGPSPTPPVPSSSLQTPPAPTVAPLPQPPPSLLPAAASAKHRARAVPALGRALPSAAHVGRQDSRQAAASAGPVAPSAPRRGHGRGRGPGAGRAPRRARAKEVRQAQPQVGSSRGGDQA